MDEGESVCVVKVIVADCRRPGGISVDQPFFAVGRNDKIRWDLVPDTFEFAGDGIEFAGPDVAPLRPRRASEFRFQIRRRDGQDHFYQVRVKGCLPMDPWVRNQ